MSCDDFRDIPGREKEVKAIHSFLESKIQLKKPGILYVTGQPGTGKTMSINHVLDKFKAKIPIVNINCLKAKSSKQILTKICDSLGLAKFVKFNESEMTDRIAKKLTSRTSESHLIVLDELDQLPKSKNVDLIRNIFSWTNQSHSKLIVVGIANTANLTSKQEAVSLVLGQGSGSNLTKIVFKPYTSKDMKSILMWYLENDENFEDADIEPKVIDMIALRFSREKGDIRAALNALFAAIEDTTHQSQTKPSKQGASEFPTPPVTPPMSPCKERTNLTSFVNSTKKRHRETNYLNDAFPFAHQVILTCIYKLSGKLINSPVNIDVCKNFIALALSKFGLGASRDECRSMLDTLEMQGFIIRKKCRPREKILLKISEDDFINLVKRKDVILETINGL